MKKSIQMILLVFMLSVFFNAVNAQEMKEPWPGVTAKVLAESDKMTVTQVTFAPGAVADWHSHKAHSVYAVTDVKMKAEVKGKEPATVEVKAGEAVSLPAVKHKTTNIGEAAFTVIVTEMK
ncbi:cupin domain-containing protein [Flavobacterium amniphilum]|uniref:cupin domain-containing protein n=1 Tax=Flavobacterium amniphilum TaxID=1834035 RepID=UPI002029C545|nr:cupin domain-containing protein [Flavobacterium amniphilum]MCL9806204.1 cupin domain-containing protein [Flavobacterium amniphilum]